MTTNPTVSIIAALDIGSRALGKGRQLLFHIPADMRRFKERTTGHAVIMGRKTWESLPAAFRPLPHRTNIVITRNMGYEAQGAVRAPDLHTALQIAREHETQEIFIIGGAQVYSEALPYADRLYLTLIQGNADGDVFFPEYAMFSKEIEREDHPESVPAFSFVTLER